MTNYGVFHFSSMVVSYNIMHFVTYSNVSKRWFNLFLLLCEGMSQPHFEGVWGWHSHSRNGDLGVLWDSQKLRTRLQGSKHLALRCSLYRWKVLEAYMSKMASHEPFGHLQDKLCAKEGPGVKVAIWFPTTKSWELAQFPCAQVTCEIPLESSRRRLQLCFRLHCNRRSAQEVMRPQSRENPSCCNFGTPTWDSRDKKPFGCGPSGVA
jgi:hypothetical protein